MKEKGFKCSESQPISPVVNRDGQVVYMRKENHGGTDTPFGRRELSGSCRGSGPLPSWVSNYGHDVGFFLSSKGFPFSTEVTGFVPRVYELHFGWVQVVFPDEKSHGLLNLKEVWTYVLRDPDPSKPYCSRGNLSFRPSRKVFFYPIYTSTR